MSQFAFLVAYEASCLLLFFTVFCRLVHTSTGKTRALVRFAFCVLGGVAALGAVWPIKGWPFEVFAVILILAIVFVQLVTAHFWTAGAPWQFQHFKEGRHDHVS